MKRLHLYIAVIVATLWPGCLVAIEVDLRVKVKIEGKEARLRALVEGLVIYLVDEGAGRFASKVIHPVVQSSPTEGEKSFLIEANFGELKEGRYLLKCGHVGAGLSSRLGCYSADIVIDKKGDRPKEVDVSLPLNFVSLSLELAGELKDWAPGGGYSLFLEFYSTLSDEHSARIVDMSVLVSKRAHAEEFKFEVGLPMITDGVYFARVSTVSKDVVAKGKESLAKIVEIRSGKVFGGVLRFDREKGGDNP